jgi:hypothetical protein
VLRIDLTHDRSTKNDARTRAAWMVCAGAEKTTKKDVFLHSIDRDDAGSFGRLYLSASPAAARLRSPA